MDALFLSAALAEARGFLEGGRVVWVAPDGPEGITLGVDGPAGRACLCVGWEAWGPRWYVCLAGAPAEGESPFAPAAARALRGGHITALIRPGLERAVGLAVERRHGQAVRRLALWAYLWPAGRNAVLVDVDEGTVIAVARPGAWHVGDRFAPPPAAGESLLTLAEDTPEGLQARLRSRLGDTPTSLPRAMPGLGPLLAREVAFRATPAGAAGPDAGSLAVALAEVAAAGREERFAPRIVLGADGQPRALAAIPLAHVPEERQRPFSTAGAAAEAFSAARRAAAGLSADRARAERALRQARDRITRRTEKLEVELAQHRQAAAYRQMGEILVAHQRQVPRGAAEARLPDPYGPPGALRAIPLDPAASAAANVERYFKRARRGARGEALTAGRLAAARRERERIAELEKALADATTPRALRDIWAALQRLDLGARGSGGRAAGSSSEPRSPPPGPRRQRLGRGAQRPAPAARVARRFVSTDGFPILVGRDNAKNDELTLHVARPDDVWLHVEGYGGSHVVIRREGRAEVPRQTLLEAAQLAAYYSQARGQRKVPVHYTLRKYVRKPKGAKPGLVTITHEKAMFATPDQNLVRRLAAAHEPAG